MRQCPAGVRAGKGVTGRERAGSARQHDPVGPTTRAQTPDSCRKGRLRGHRLAIA